MLVLDVDLDAVQAVVDFSMDMAVEKWDASQTARPADMRVYVTPRPRGFSEGDFRMYTTQITKIVNPVTGDSIELPRGTADFTIAAFLGLEPQTATSARRANPSLAGLVDGRTAAYPEPQLPRWQAVAELSFRGPDGVDVPFPVTATTLTGLRDVNLEDFAVLDDDGRTLDLAQNLGMVRAMCCMPWMEQHLRGMWRRHLEAYLDLVTAANSLPRAVSLAHLYAPSSGTVADPAWRTMVWVIAFKLAIAQPVLAQLLTAEVVAALWVGTHDLLGLLATYLGDGWEEKHIDMITEAVRAAAALGSLVE
jgi:hypothetical protein